MVFPGTSHERPSFTSIHHHRTFIIVAIAHRIIQS